VAELRGLLIDWGGVLTTSVFASFEAFCAREGLVSDKVANAFRNDPLAREALVGLETGRLSDVEFGLKLAPVLGVNADNLIDRMNADVHPDRKMISAVRVARASGLTTGLISNSWGTRPYDDELLKLFDGVVISGQVGLRKPSPEMYERGALSVGLEPYQCVYVDDIAGNLKPARALGMTTVHHVETTSTISELSSLFGLDLGTPTE
jgi:epoxide hydrolase-like predicted phosphatase